jgi:hypothetical protein
MDLPRKLERRGSAQAEQKKSPTNASARICSTVFGGSFTKILKASPVLTEDDKDFLKEHKYI